MKFRNVVAGAVIVQGLTLLDLSPVHADVILTYTGNDFTFFTDPYTGSDKVTASITLANPLAANLNQARVTPVAFSLMDGIHTITQQNPGGGLFNFSTDASGTIKLWNIASISNTAKIFTENDNTQVTDMASITFAVEGFNQHQPGTWTETNVAVPAPPLSNLAALGVLGLAFFWRRRRQISAWLTKPSNPHRHQRLEPAT